MIRSTSFVSSIPNASLRGTARLVNAAAGSVRNAPRPPGVVIAATVQPWPTKDAGGQFLGHAVQPSIDVSCCGTRRTCISAADAEVGRGMCQHLLAVVGVVGKVPFNSPEAVNKPEQVGADRVPGEAHTLSQHPRVEDAATVLLDRPRSWERHVDQDICAGDVENSLADANLQADGFPLLIGSLP